MNEAKEKKSQSLDSIIEKIEAERKSKVIIYFTGNKQPIEQFGTLVASDTLPLFNKILKKIKNVPKISLVINTNGGHLETPWPLVNLIREHCKNFEVIILERALSVGTMITLGADKIVMSSYSQLGPIDPAANVVDNDKKQIKKIEIEDIIGYVDFIKEKIGIAEQLALAEVTKELTKEVNPTMLGSVNRTHALIRKLAKNLLYLHKDKLTEKQINEITENLTQKLYSHSHLINRREAKNIVGFGNIIEFASDKLENLLDDLFDYYLEFLEVNKEFNPFQIIGEQNEKEFVLSRAAVHSKEVKYNFISSYKILKLVDPAGIQQIRVDNTNNKWELK